MAVGGWDESKHPRVPAGGGDASGEWTSGGTPSSESKVPPTVRDKDGQITEHAGLNEAQWTDWATDSMNVNDALNGELRVGFPNSYGQKLTANNVAEMKMIGEKIQTAASNTTLLLGEGGRAPMLYRGESFDSVEAFNEQYKYGKHFTTSRLTSTASFEEGARQYAETNPWGDKPAVQVLLRFQSSDRKLHGVQTAQLGVLSGEVIMPKGIKFRVARVGKLLASKQTFYVVDMYTTEKHKGPTTSIWFP